LTIIDVKEQRGSWLFLGCICLFLTAHNSEKRLQRSEQVQHVGSMKDPHIRRDAIKACRMHTRRFCQKYEFNNYPSGWKAYIRVLSLLGTNDFLAAAVSS
jgi:hypothetical protein